MYSWDDTRKSYSVMLHKSLMKPVEYIYLISA